MQILKEDVRQRILDAACDEFYESGYAKASVREIAKASSVSLSNIYNYFPSKDALFDAIVCDVSLALLNLLNTVNISHSSDENKEMPRDKFFDLLTSKLLEIISCNSRQTVILIEKSDGSRFESTKASLVSLLAAHFAAELNTGDDPSGSVLYNVIASGFITGIIRLIDNAGDNLSAAENIRFFMKYHLNGINSLKA
jgi:AcrR family transcriptional regulator